MISEESESFGDSLCYHCGVCNEQKFLFRAQGKSTTPNYVLCSICGRKTCKKCDFNHICEECLSFSPKDLQIKYKKPLRTSKIIFRIAQVLTVIPLVFVLFNVITNPIFFISMGMIVILGITASIYRNYALKFYKKIKTNLSQYEFLSQYQPYKFLIRRAKYYKREYAANRISMDELVIQIADELQQEFRYKNELISNKEGQNIVKAFFGSLGI